MKINVIMCLSNDSILGVNNDLYVKIGEDLKYFKHITSDNYYKDKPNVLIMGYNTYKSIGKPLPNRLNIVISRNHQNELDDLSITNFPSFDDVLQYLEYKDDIGKIFIIGGASIYLDVFKNYLPLIDNVYLTKVHTPQLSDMQYLKSVNKATYCNISLNDYINSKKLIHLHTKKCTGNTTIMILIQICISIKH